MSEILQSKDEVMSAFKALLVERKRIQAHISTKEEVAQREKQKEQVKVASEYTANAIVKGLADLQLNFGDAVERLGIQLSEEASKLDTLKLAISIETENLKNLNDVRIAADALHILKQENEARTKEFDAFVANEIKAIEEEITKKREDWEKEQKEYDLNLAEAQAQRQKNREKELADYKYDLDRTYKLDADAYTEKKKLMERELNETELKKQRDWSNREKALTENQPKFQEYKAKIDGAEAEIKTAVEKARDEAMKAASKEAKIKADLLEKENEGAKQVYEMQLANLNENISKNNAQIEKLQAELKEALAQIQSLSLKAVGGK